jgi:hypothetical protein
MRLHPRVFAVCSAVALTAACSAGRHSASGFRLPDDGDVQRGQIAFVEKGCHTCHMVPGVDLPKPTIEPAVPVRLGGEVAWKVTDGYLVTSIINPSFALARYPTTQTTIDGKSRMPHYSENITARELTDIVTFLHQQYKEVRPVPTNAPY